MSGGIEQQHDLLAAFALFIPAKDQAVYFLPTEQPMAGCLAFAVQQDFIPEQVPSPLKDVHLLIFHDLDIDMVQGQANDLGVHG